MSDISKDQNQPTLSKVDSLNESFDRSGITWREPRHAILENFQKQGNPIEYDESGAAYSFVDGSRVPLRLALAHYAAHGGRGLADGRSASLRANNSGVTSKADLTSVGDRVAYITSHGADAYARLPVQPVNREVVTREDFSRLPVAHKVELIRQNGSDYAATLPSEKAKPTNGLSDTSASRKLVELRSKNKFS